MLKNEFQPDGVVLIDGGLSTELEYLGFPIKVKQ